MRSLDAAIGRSRRLARAARDARSCADAARTPGEGMVLTSIEDKHGRVVGRRNERDECANK